jgi:hypothetical protein
VGSEGEAGNERMYNEAFEPRSNNNHKENGAKVAPVRYAKKCERRGINKENN